MGQTTVTDTMRPGEEGLLYGSDHDIKSGISAELIYFGRALGISATADMDKLPHSVSLFTSGQLFAGVSMRESSLEGLPDPSTGEPNQAGYGAYKTGFPANVVRKGCIWVVSDTAVDSRSKGVYVRNADTIGTAAYVTTTTFTITALEGESFTVTITGYAVQTVTFTAAATTQAAVLAEINSQLKGCHAEAVSANIRIVTDQVGSTITIAASNITAQIVWDTPVAGTGTVANYAENSRGSFRCYTASQTVSGFTEISTYARWEYGVTFNAKYYGIVRIL